MSKDDQLRKKFTIRTPEVPNVQGLLVVAALVSGALIDDDNRELYRTLEQAHSGEEAIPAANAVLQYFGLDLELTALTQCELLALCVLRNSPNLYADYSGCDCGPRFKALAWAARDACT